MKTIALVAAIVAAPLASSAATFEFTANPALLEYSGLSFSQDAFGEQYDASDLVVTGSFDLTGDFDNGFSSSGASFSVLAPNGIEYSEAGEATARYSDFRGDSSLVIFQTIEGETVSDYGFENFEAAARTEGAITAGLLSDASSFWEVVRDPGRGDYLLGAYSDDPALTVTSGSLDLPPAPSPVPVPAAAPLLLLGLGGLGWAARRKRA